MQEKIEILKIRCPKCGVQADYHGNPWRPFCSQRCQQLDLGDWADEGYRIAGDPVPNPQDDEP